MVVGSAPAGVDAVDGDWVFWGYDGDVAAEGLEYA